MISIPTDTPDTSEFLQQLGFHEVVHQWFSEQLGALTAAQQQAWPRIAEGENSLILAPTGSSKTLAGFLWAISGFLKSPAPPATKTVRLLYISPLKALNYDIERNLRVPLTQMQDLAAARGESLPEIRIAVRTGDTKTSTRNSILRNPPDILITTPESLYLMLTAPKARTILHGVESVILDEIHAIAGNKRGTHLAVSLERLEELRSVEAPLQRIGLSATARPPEAIASLLGGFSTAGQSASRITTVAGRPVSVGIKSI